MNLCKISPTSVKDSTVRHCNFCDTCISNSISVRVESGHKHLMLYIFPNKYSYPLTNITLTWKTFRPERYMIGDMTFVWTFNEHQTQLKIYNVAKSWF